MIDLKYNFSKYFEIKNGQMDWEESFLNFTYALWYVKKYIL